MNDVHVPKDCTYYSFREMNFFNRISTRNRIELLEMGKSSVLYRGHIILTLRNATNSICEDMDVSNPCQAISFTLQPFVICKAGTVIVK